MVSLKRNYWVSDDIRALHDNLGLDTETTMKDLPTLALSNYMNCYPLGDRLVSCLPGYDSKDVVKRVDSFLHEEDEPTEKGLDTRVLASPTRPLSR